MNPSVAELHAAAPAPPTVPDLKSPLERAAFWQRERIAVVYAIQGEPRTPVKIGKAVDVEARLKSLQTGSFMLLRLLEVIPGGYEVESKIHRALAGDRLQGEWFQGQATDRLVDGLADFAVASVEHFVKRGMLPELPGKLLPPAARRKGQSGFKSPDFGSNSLGHRWRTQSGERAPVKVRFVDPDTLRSDAA